MIGGKKMLKKMIKLNLSNIAMASVFMASFSGQVAARPPLTRLAPLLQKRNLSYLGKKAVTTASPIREGGEIFAERRKEVSY